jgi:hypothetical protein
MSEQAKTFRAVVNYQFDTEIEVVAHSFEEAEELANNIAQDLYLPYTSEKGYTDFWHTIDVDVVEEN